MNINRSALSACVVKGLPNVRDYIDHERSNFENKKKRNNANLAAATAANPRIAAANAVAQANDQDVQNFGARQGQHAAAPAAVQNNRQEDMDQ